MLKLSSLESPKTEMDTGIVFGGGGGGGGGGGLRGLRGHRPPHFSSFCCCFTNLRLF